MRALILLLLACIASTSVVSSQENQPTPAPPHPVLVDDVPEGTNWIANARTSLYYPVGCPVTASIPAADKLFYKSETSLRAGGFTKSDECKGSTTPSNRAPPAIRDSSSITKPAAETAHGSPNTKNLRQGFWFNIGFGYGSLGCEACDGHREGSYSGGLALGGALSQKVMLGGGTNAWTKSENGATLTVSTLVALIRFYPSATGGFFLLGGLGVGSIHGEVSGFGSETQTGYGALAGLGYDIRVGSNVSLTPFVNGFATNTSDSDANVGQIGLGLTVH